MQEISVVLKVHELLKTNPLGNRRAIRLYTDSHPAYTAYSDLQPFQRFSLNVGGFVLYPDLVGQFDDGETIFAVEAKGSSDWLKGLAQAEMYQYGFHYTFLAIDLYRANELVEIGKRKNIGIIGVDEQIHLLHIPTAQQPYREPFQFIQRQMETVIQLTGPEAFQYNIPTHYLVLQRKVGRESGIGR